MYWPPNMGPGTVLCPRDVKADVFDSQELWYCGCRNVKSVLSARREIHIWEPGMEFHLGSELESHLGSEGE